MSTTIKMLITLGIIGIISGGLLSGIADWASPLIEMHRIEETKAAIFEVVPEATDYKLDEKVTFEMFRVMNNEGNQIGYALPIEGNGFQGKIRLMIGVTNDLKKITGLKILEQLETPGLGNKIVDAPFTDQFINLSTIPKVNYVKGITPENPNEIQAITGATISSKSVVKIINDGLAEMRSDIAVGGENE